MPLLGAEHAHGLEKEKVRQTPHLRSIVICGCVVRRPFGWNLKVFWFADVKWCVQCLCGGVVDVCHLSMWTVTRKYDDFWMLMLGLELCVMW